MITISVFNGTSAKLCHWDTTTSPPPQQPHIREPILVREKTHQAIRFTVAIRCDQAFYAFALCVGVGEIDTIAEMERQVGVAQRLQLLSASQYRF